MWMLLESNEERGIYIIDEALKPQSSRATAVLPENDRALGVDRKLHHTRTKVIDAHRILHQFNQQFHKAGSIFPEDFPANIQVPIKTSHREPTRKPDGEKGKGRDKKAFSLSDGCRLAWWLRDGAARSHSGLRTSCERTVGESAPSHERAEIPSPSQRADARAERREGRETRRRQRSLSATGVSSRDDAARSRAVGYALAASAPSARARRRTSEPRCRRRANKPTRAPNDEKEDGRDEAAFSLNDGCRLA